MKQALRFVPAGSVDPHGVDEEVILNKHRPRRVEAVQCRSMEAEHVDMPQECSCFWNDADL